MMIEKTEMQHACQLSGRTYVWQHVLQAINPKAGLTLILGDNGSGKTYWSHQLQKEYKHAYAMSCHRSTNIMNILKQLAHFFDISIQLEPLTVEEHVKHIVDVLHLSQSYYICIDNADWLSDDAIDLLLRLGSCSEQYKIHVILLGSPHLLEKTKRLNYTECYIHEIAIRPMDIKELALFIYETYLTVGDIDPGMLRRIHRAAGGFPGETRKLVQDYWQELFISKGFVEAKSITTYKPQYSFPTESSSRKKKLNVKRIMISVLLCVMLMLVVSRFFSAKESIMPSSGALGMRLALPTPSQEIPAAVEESKEAPVQQCQYVSDTDLQNFILPVLTAEPRKLSAVGESLLPEAVGLNETVSETPKLLMPEDQIIQASVPTHGVAKTETADAFVLQVALVDDTSKYVLERLQKKMPEDFSGEIVKIYRKGKPLWLLVVGPFEDVNKARDAKKLIASDIIEKYQPWIRKNSFLQAEMLHDAY